MPKLAQVSHSAAHNCRHSGVTALYSINAASGRRTGSISNTTQAKIKRMVVFNTPNRGPLGRARGRKGPVGQVAARGAAAFLAATGSNRSVQKVRPHGATRKFGPAAGHGSRCGDATVHRWAVGRFRCQQTFWPVRQRLGVRQRVSKLPLSRPGGVGHPKRQLAAALHDAGAPARASILLRSPGPSDALRARSRDFSC